MTYGLVSFGILKRNGFIFSLYLASELFLNLKNYAMILCKCIDDSNRPGDFPLSKWVKEGEEYHITYAVRLLPQNVLGYSLYEKPIGPECFPYEYFTRFAIRDEDVEALEKMYVDIGESISLKDMKKLFGSIKKQHS
jgi:hypothetical protein